MFHIVAWTFPEHKLFCISHTQQLKVYHCLVKNSHILVNCTVLIVIVKLLPKRVMILELQSHMEQVEHNISCALPSKAYINTYGRCSDVILGLL